MLLIDHSHKILQDKATVVTQTWNSAPTSGIEDLHEPALIELKRTAVRILSKAPGYSAFLSSSSRQSLAFFNQLMQHTEEKRKEEVIF